MTKEMLLEKFFTLRSKMQDATSEAERKALYDESVRIQKIIDTM